MDTQKRTKEIYRFIILKPHRDSSRPLEEYRRRLFAAGFCGAYSFPAAAPLAVVSRPFCREELKALARSIRELSGKTEGKIQSSGTALNRAIGKYSFFGPQLSLSVNEGLFGLAKDKVLHVFLSPVFCATLVDSEFDPVGTNRPGENLTPGEAPILSFRAASLANLAIRPLGAGDSAYSFEWRIGPPVWLPKYKGTNE